MRILLKSYSISREEGGDEFEESETNLVEKSDEGDQYSARAKHNLVIAFVIIIVLVVLCATITCVKRSQTIILKNKR